MPEIIVKIEWDWPDEQFWLNPDNIAVALHAYCKNTQFKIIEVDANEERNEQIGPISDGTE